MNHHSYVYLAPYLLEELGIPHVHLSNLVQQTNELDIIFEMQLKDLYWTSRLSGIQKLRVYLGNLLLRALLWLIIRIFGWN